MSGLEVEGYSEDVSTKFSALEKMQYQVKPLEFQDVPLSQ